MSHNQAKADRKLAKQLRRAAVDPYYEEPQAQANTQPARRMGKSNKDIAKRQARISAKQQSDAALQRRLQQLQGNVGRPTKMAAPTTQHAFI